MSKQAGSQQKRVTLDDGREIILPVDAVLMPRHKPGDPLNADVTEADEIEAGADDVFAGDQD